MGGGGVNLTAILAKFRRNPRDAERVVDLFLAVPGHAFVIRHAKQTVLVQLEPMLDRAIAQRDVVRLRAVKYCIAAPRLSAGTRRRSA